MKSLLAYFLSMVAFGAFMVYIGWPMIITAAVQEVEMRQKRAEAHQVGRVMLGISVADKSCTEWGEKWACIRPAQKASR